MAVSANRLELLQIADAVAREKSIDRSIVITAMEDAIAKAAAVGLTDPLRDPGFRGDGRTAGPSALGQPTEPMPYGDRASVPSATTVERH